MNHYNEKFVGLDLGSTAAKMAVIRDGKIQFTKVVPSHQFKELVSEISADTSRVFSTGYFRDSVDAEASCTEISAAKYGVQFLLGSNLKPEVLVDIGGQDTKVIDLRSQDFILNDKCSAGTGAFLQFMAQYLGLEVEELGSLHKKARGEWVQINSTCSVFALSEVISHLVESVPREIVIAGVHRAFARRIAHMVPRDAQTVGLLGGPALNRGVVESLAELLGLEVGESLLVLKPPQFVNAIGTILFGTCDVQSHH